MFFRPHQEKQGNDDSNESGRKTRPAEAQTNGRANRDDLGHRQSDKRFASKKDKNADNAGRDRDSGGGGQRWSEKVDDIDIIAQRSHAICLAFVTRWASSL